MRVLVTGGMGFIGSNFVRLLLAERPGWEVWNLDALTYAGNPENLADLADKMVADGTPSATTRRAGWMCGRPDQWVAVPLNDTVKLSALPWLAASHVDGTLTSSVTYAVALGARVLDDSAEDDT